MHLTSATLQELDHRYRVALINSLSGFKSANLIGTVNGSGQTNLSIVSSCFHLGADPALLGFVVRPHSVDRHTLENILESGVYTCNQVGSAFYREAHQTSARYPRSVSEFDAAGLTPVWEDEFPAPGVAEASIRTGLNLRQTVEMEINGTVLVIGEIGHIWLAEALVGEDGFVDLEAADTVAVSGLDSYHQTRRLARLAYAKPDQGPRELENEPNGFPVGLRRT